MNLAATMTLLLLGAPIGSIAEASQSQAARRPALPAADLPVLSKPARLQVERVRLADALEQLSTSSGVALAYSPSALPREARASCHCTSQTLGEALLQLLNGTGFGFRELQGQVVIVPSGSRGGPIRTVEPPAHSSGALGIVRSLLREAMAEPPRVVDDVATITGTVSSEAGAPVSGAIVILPSLQLSTFTDGVGGYRLVVPTARVVSGRDSLRVERIGFATRTVGFDMNNGEIRVDVVLAFRAVQLDEVVVTGTAGNQQRRAQPAVVASINASDIMASAPVLSVSELLTARTPGVSITRGSGSTGAASRITIRGIASLGLSNNPLVFVDGVKINSGSRSAAVGVGGQMIDGLSDLNAADIESIEIVKGPAAATLYGADATAGVIQILTKRGRIGSRAFTQNLSLEYDNIDPNFTPFTNYYRCATADVTPTSNAHLCRNQTVGTVVTDNPLVRQNAFRDGSTRVLNYSARGSGDNFGYFASFGNEDEDGTLRSNSLLRRAGRVNFNWSADPRLGIEAGMGVSRTDVKLAMGDQQTYGYLIGTGFGTPRTVQIAADGTVTGGWLNANQSVESVSAIQNDNQTTRLTPTVTLRYGPLPWFTNTLTLGADYLRQQRSTFYPKNSTSWYSAVLNTGSIVVESADRTQYTVNYLGNINRRFGEGGWISSDLSFGSQWLNDVSTQVNAQGTGLITNASNVVSQTSANRIGGESFGQFKQLGLFGQLMLGFNDRIFVKLAERVDRSSAFAKNQETFLLPSFGVSYVATQDPYWDRILPDQLSTLKVRAAYGETGRAPGATAALQTYVPSPYLTETGLLVVGGVAPGNPGNPDLKPERGTEWEGGFDLGLFRDRIGLELTYFNKTSKDLIVSNPVPPSSGFSSSPAANIGEMKNTGFELSARATLIARPNLVWDVAGHLNTLKNEIVEVENVNPINNRRCFKANVEIAAFCVNRIITVDTITGVVTVTDTAQFLGGQFPKREGSLNTTLTLFNNFRVYAQFDGKWDYLIFNFGRQFRDRLNGANSNSKEAVLTREELGLSAHEWYRLHPTRVVFASGGTGGLTNADEDYFEDGSFVRLREVSFTWTLPPSMTSALRVAKGLAVTVGGRNLGLWTDYKGYDPEVLATDDAAGQLFRADLFTVPQNRRLFARLNLQF